MKRIAIVLTALALTACNYRVQHYEVINAEKACSTHGGVEGYILMPIYHNVICNDGTYSEIKTLKRSNE